MHLSGQEAKLLLKMKRVSADAHKLDLVCGVKLEGLAGLPLTFSLNLVKYLENKEVSIMKARYNAIYKSIHNVEFGLLDFNVDQFWCSHLECSAHNDSIAALVYEEQLPNASNCGEYYCNVENAAGKMLLSKGYVVDRSFNFCVPGYARFPCILINFVDLNDN